MSRVLIHIGAHKTGTTYLQQVLARLRPALRSRGVVFPEKWSDSVDQPGHRGLYDALNAERIDAARRDIAELLADGAERIVISAEDLGYLSESSVATLRAMFGEESVSIVYYCRRWSGLLPSVWQERVKHGATETLPQFVSAALASASQLSFVDFDRVLARWRQAFGRDAIHLVSYDAVIGSNSDIAAHFVHTFLPEVGAALGGVADILGTQPNRSMTPLEVEAVRALNALHGAGGGVAGAAVREWITQGGNALVPEALLSAMARHTQQLELSDAMHGLEGLHAALAAKYRDRLVQPVPSRGLFEPSINRVAWIAPDYTREPTTRDALVALYDRFLLDSGLPPRTWAVST